MKFRKTGFEGLFVIELERLAESRGFFVLFWCTHESAAQVVASLLNISYNENGARFVDFIFRKTLRGRQDRSVHQRAHL